MIHCHEMWYSVDFSLYPISLMLHHCITYDINMTLLWWMSVAKSSYQFFSSSWSFLEFGHHLVYFKYWQYLNIDALKTYFSKFLTTSAEQNLCRAPFDVCFWQYIGGKTLCSFLTNVDRLRKTYPRPIYSLFEILSNENLFKQLVTNSLSPNFKEVY